MRNEPAILIMKYYIGPCIEYDSKSKTARTENVRNPFDFK